MFVLLLLGLLTQAPEARGAVRNLGCIACEKVVQELAGFGENKTAVNQTISELDRKCASAFANNTKKRDACDKLVKGLVDIVPSAYKVQSTLTPITSTWRHVAGSASPRAGRPDIVSDCD